MSDCKYCQDDDVCVNANFLMCADYCPVANVPGVCRFEERRGRTMILKYIGRDGSKNLRVGQVYDVKVFTRGTSIRVSWIVPGERGTKSFAYNSPEALAKNWEAVK